MTYSLADSDGNSALHVAAQKNFYLIAQTLIKAGTNVDCTNHRVCFQYKPVLLFY